MAGQKGMKNYSLEFRGKVAKERLETGATIQQMQLKYNIPSQAQVYNWCKWYRENGVAKQVTGKKRGRPRKVNLEANCSCNNSSCEENNE